ncbi:MAG: YgjV family protein [Firmicutes bacterium]|nr:YgjV family protein [Bacillota bacterium]
MIDIFPQYYGAIPLWAYILSQVFGLITAALVFYTFAFIGSKPKIGEKVTCEAEKKALDLKHQQKRFTWLAIWASTWLVMFIFLGQFTGIILAGFALLRNIVFRIVIGSQNKKVKIFAKSFLGFSVLVGLIGAILPHFIFPSVHLGWLDLVVVLSSIIYIVGTFLPNKHIFNAGTVQYSTWLILLAVAAMNVPVIGYSTAIPATEYIIGSDGVRVYGTTFWGMFTSARYIGSSVGGGGDNYVWSQGLPNFAGMVIEVIKLGAVAVFYYFWFFKGGKDKLTVQKESSNAKDTTLPDTQGAEIVGEVIENNGELTE